MTENWQDVPGWEGFYAVSDTGRVKALARSVPGRPGVFINRRERQLTISTTDDGYRRVWLSRDNKRTEFKVHQLVALAFIGPRPEGMEVCHNDGDKANNTPANLRYGTRSENTLDRVQHGTHMWARKTHCPQDHPYDLANTYVTPSGSRTCRKCRAEHKRTARANRKAA